MPSEIRVDTINNRSGLGTITISDTGVVFAGVTTVAAGSTSAPSINPSGDSNTGIFFPSADTIAFGEGGSETARIDSSGRLLVGTTTTVGANRTLQVAGTGAEVFYNSSDNDAAAFFLSKSRGTLASPTVVQSGDATGYIRFRGHDGSGYLDTASITSFVDGTPGTNDMPGRLVFSTTADGASSPTERLRISSGGIFTAVSIYNNTTGSSANVVIRSDGVFERSTSSIKYKTDIEDLQDSYADAILNVRPIWYRSTCSSDDPSHSWWGFLAEEVAAVDPRLVHWKTFEVSHDENGSAVSTPCEPEPDGVAYERFVPHLLNLIKRQGEAIADLQAEVAALKAQ